MIASRRASASGFENVEINGYWVILAGKMWDNRCVFCCVVNFFIAGIL